MGVTQWAPFGRDLMNKEFIFIWRMLAMLAG